MGQRDCEQQSTDAGLLGGQPQGAGQAEVAQVAERGTGRCGRLTSSATFSAVPR